MFIRASATLLLACLVLPAHAQNSASGDTPIAPAQPAPAEAAPAPAPPTAWVYKGFSFSGYLDTFYNNNLNRPFTRFSQVQALNITANKMSLGSATGSCAYDPKPLGFRVDVGYGRTYDAFYISEPKHTDWSRYLLNAYVTLKPASWRGVQLDFGKFVTSAGSEVTEPHLNWNYSRSLLFSFGPYYHTGVRLTAPLRSNWTVGVHGVTGWNTMRDNNTGKTLGLTSVNTFKKVTVANNFYTGPENSGTNKGWRNFYDLAVTVTPTSKLSAYFNYDVGRNKSPLSQATMFWGMAGAARYTINKYLAIAPRFDYYSDSDGFWTGTPQAFKDFTLTGETRINDSFLTRIEFRRDWSDQPFFIRNQGDLMKHQNMVIASFIMVVKPGMLDFVKK